MRYGELEKLGQEELIQALLSTIRFLHESFDGLSPDEALLQGPNGSFSPVEQAWHLADLEREGFGLRIQRLQTEMNPALPDFDGARMAVERNYKSLSLAAGLAAFEASRRANISALGSLKAETWARHGTQEGIGSVALCDIPIFMRQHDQAHIQDIQAWQKHNGLPVIAAPAV